MTDGNALTLSVLQQLDLLTDGAGRHAQPARGFDHALTVPERIEHL
jgi:hypothetical protein